jgi:hypothetical protein
LLPEVAGFLNSVMNGVYTLKSSFITAGKEMCADCEQFLTEKEQRIHNANGQCQNSVYLVVPSLLSSFVLKDSYSLTTLKRYLPNELQATVTTASIDNLRAQITRAKTFVDAGRFTVNMDSVSKCLFTNRDHWDRCLRGPLFLLLKVLTVPSSEAFMETLGSMMEKLHKRFNHSEASMDDRRLQRELFIKINGPPIICADPLIKKVLAHYRNQRNPTFAHEASTLARITGSSHTIMRLKREAETDPNRLGFLSFD